MYFILLILGSDVLMFHSWHQSACQQLFWHWEKLIFFNKLISETFCLLGLLNSRSAYQDQQVCAWFSLARLPTEAASKIISVSFSKRYGFIFRFLVSRTSSMPRQNFFVPYLLPSHVKYYPYSQNFPPFQNGRGKDSVMMTSIVHLSSNRS